MIEAGALGKKVFFLYPHPVLKDVTEELARREFEIYLVNDHAKLAKALVGMPDSIIFVNIDDGMDEERWEVYIKDLRADPRTSTVGIGILTMNEDRELTKKYLMDIQVPCGFVVVKIGAAKTIEILDKTLEANEARGRRRFVRAACIPGAAQCFVTLDGKQLRGSLSDLSSAGLAMSFDEATELRPGTVLRGLQLTIKGSHVVVDGFVAAKREDPESQTHIIMFDPASLDETKRDKLRGLVSRLNQLSLDRLFETL